MPTYSQVQVYRGRGLTFSEIGEVFGLSRQRIHAIFTGYKHTEDYRAYKRHYDYHMIGKKYRKECKYC